MDDKTIVKQKLKPAKKYISKEKVNEVKEKLEDISSSVSFPPPEPEQSSEEEGQTESTDVVVPECQPNSKPPDMPEGNQVTVEEPEMLLSQITLKNFCIAIESAVITALNDRAIAHKKAFEETVKKNAEAGITTITPENALMKCSEYLNIIVTDCNLYKNHKNAISQQQNKELEIAKQDEENIKRLETLVGRIEKVQGVKAPKRPPFPSWACLAYLLWHWPMYAFAYLWLSKYFRRFCFLIAFFVIVLEFCLICFLASDNRNMRLDHAKYVTVRNWSYVMEDTSAMNRFNRVDLLFEDVRFNEEKIRKLNEFIRNKNEKNLKRGK